MPDPKPQPAFEPKAIGPLLERLSEVLSALERLLQAYRDASATTVDENNASPCSSRQSGGTEQCSKIQTALPKVNHGRGRRERLISFDPSTLERIRQTKHIDTFEPYERCKDMLTDKQYVAAYLYYREGLTQSQIADQFGKSRSAVSTLLKRADKVKNVYERQMRKERIEYLKKHKLD